MDQRIDNLISAIDDLSNALWCRGLIGDLTYSRIQNLVEDARKITALASPSGHSAEPAGTPSGPSECPTSD
jgi:hypothetical protein